MIEAAFAIPGDLTLPTGGYAYDRRLMGLLPVNGVNVHVVPLSHRFPQPTEIDLAAARRAFNNLPAGTVLLIDGLAYGAMPGEILASVRQPIVALVHHPLAFETGLSPSRERELFALEHEALGFARHTITTSETTKRLLVSDYGVPHARITVAEPGTDPRPRAMGSGAPLRLLSVGAVSTRKGYHVLVEALGLLADLEWEATIAGSLDRDPQAVANLKTAMMAKGLRARIDLAGAISDTGSSTRLMRTPISSSCPRCSRAMAWF